MKNIILIGMPAAGKSTLGAPLAKALGYRFIDSDDLLREKFGKSLEEIIDDTSEEQFLVYENDLHTTIQIENTVLATGGSVVYGESGMKHLKEIGTVVYLKTDIELLRPVLSNLHARGVIVHGHKTLDGLYNERVGLYEKYADITVDVTTTDIETNVKEILAAL